jgi:hypothetical protein
MTASNQRQDEESDRAAQRLQEIADSDYDGDIDMARSLNHSLANAADKPRWRDVRSGKTGVPTQPNSGASNVAPDPKAAAVQWYQGLQK